MLFFCGSSCTLAVTLVMITTSTTITEAAQTNCAYNQLGDIRVVANSVTGDNTVEQCRKGSNYANTWVMVCGSGWDCREAEVVCREILNVDNPKVIPGTSHISKGLYLIRYSCNGNENSLSFCSGYATYCNTVAHAVCIRPRNCPHHGAIRLVGGTSDTGKLELCYNGEWSPLSINSGFGYNEAATACRQLGFTAYPRLILDDGQFNSVDAYSWITNIVCDGDEKSLLNCDVYNSNSTSCSHDTHLPSQFGLKCYEAPTAPQCSDGTVRLVGGRIEQEGRVEVCWKGVWGSVCNSQFTATNLYITCTYLGYHGNGNTFLGNNAFGSGEGPIFRGFDCQGWEQNMAECFNSSQQYSRAHNLDCNIESATAVRCSDFCRAGDIRLVGGPNNKSGIVEVCNNNLWGFIAEPGWSDNNTRVVCKELGLGQDGVTVHKASRSFSRPKKPIHLANVYCRGSESVLSDCAAYVSSISIGINMMKNVDVVGVTCMSKLQPSPVVQLQSQNSSQQMVMILKSSVVTAGFMGLIFLMLLLLLGSVAVIAVVRWSHNKKIERISWQNLPADEEGI